MGGATVKAAGPLVEPPPAALTRQPGLPGAAGPMLSCRAFSPATVPAPHREEPVLRGRPPERSPLALFAGFWLPVLAYVGAIYAVSAQPHLTPPFHFVNADKVIHAAEYLVLGLLLARALRASLRVGRPAFAAMIAIGLVVLIGSGDEFLQSFVPGRDSSIFDLLADAVGGALAQFVYVNVAKG
jgi:VanZ family protein